MANETAEPRNVFSRLIPDIARNPISVIGAGITTIAAGLFLFVFLADVFGLYTNPYVGMMFFLVMPALFLFGLALVPVGVVMERRRRRRGKEPFSWPVLDLRDPRTRRLTVIVGGLTLLNILILSLATYRGLEYMDSVEFCGQLCHEVMEPEHVAYLDGPHSRVKCVECHIGAGADWFVKSKLSGTRQIFAVTFNTFQRPIPTPVENLRPARGTCEQCHWPEKFHGDLVDSRTEFAEDEANTPTATTLRLHVGGSSEQRGVATGIHWHTNPNNVVDYVAVDEKRQEIPYVRLTNRQTGKVTEYRVEGTDPAKLQAGERRQMDCVDCHNRPAHAFSMTAERALNVAMAAGVIPKDLPYIRREGASVLKVEYPTTDDAVGSIDRALRGFYAQNYADLVTSRKADIDQAVAGVQWLYRRNVFPGMRVTWGTHLNNRGHVDAAGCFRCHDDEHKSADGKVIAQDCNLCHDIE